VRFAVPSVRSADRVHTDTGTARADDGGRTDTVAYTQDLHVTFRRGGRDIHAVRGLTLDVKAGEILGLVGESGSGKSVLAMALLGLIDKRARVSGVVRVMDRDMVTGSPGERRQVRIHHLGAVFQDPMSSLNPTMKIGRQVTESVGILQAAADPRILL
jgi:peptide/nickel transport system ATP-binding protein